MQRKTKIEDLTFEEFDEICEFMSGGPTPKDGISVEKLEKFGIKVTKNLGRTETMNDIPTVEEIKEIKDIKILSLDQLIEKECEDIRSSFKNLVKYSLQNGYKEIVLYSFCSAEVKKGVYEKIKDELISKGYTVTLGEHELSQILVSWN